MKSVTYVPERLLPIYPVYTKGGDTGMVQLLSLI